MENKKKQKKKFKILWVLGKILLGIFLFLLLLILFIRSPWGQDIVVNQITSYVSGKTNTTVGIESLFITISGNVELQGLFLEDEKGDTLIYSENLEADIPLWPIIRGKGVSLDFLEWRGVRANIVREDSIKGYNYEFLLEALAPTDSTAAQDTTATNQNISLGELGFRDFHLTYMDQVAGIDSKIKLGLFKTEMEEMDLENMVFKMEMASLSNSEINYLQTKPFPEPEEEQENPLPFLSFANLELENVIVNYHSEPDGLLANLEVGLFSAGVPKIDLPNNFIELDKLRFNNSNVLVENNQEEQETGMGTSGNASQSFEWPEYTFSAQKMSLENNNISYFLNGALPQEGTFNPDAIDLKNINFIASDLFLKDKTAGVLLDRLDFKEGSGLEMKELAGNLHITDHKLKIAALVFKFNENELKGNLALQYESMETLINSPENSQIDADISTFGLWIRDIFPFQPELRNNEALLALSRKKFTGNIRANGNLATLQIPAANFYWGQNTALSANGIVRSPMQPEEITFDFPDFRLDSQRADAVEFVKEEELGIRIPARLRLEGDIKGSMTDLNTMALLTTSEGDLELKGSFLNNEKINFDAYLEVKQLQLGNILMNEQLGALNLSLTTSGSGTELNTLDAVLESTISSFQFNNYQFLNIPVSGEIKNGKGAITTGYTDENLDMGLVTSVELDSVSPRFVADLDLRGADFEALGITKRNIKGALNLIATFEGNTDSYEVNSTVTDGLAVYDARTYLMGDLEMYAYVRPDSTSMTIDNNILQLQLRSNSNPPGIVKALQRHFESYLEESGNESFLNDVQLDLRGSVSQAPILNEVFLSDLQELDSIDIAVDFKEKDRMMTAHIILPYINYGGNEIDSLAFHLNSDKEDLNFDLGFNALTAGPLAIKKTLLEGSVAGQMLFMDFNSYYEEEHLVHVKSETSKNNDSIRIHINPSEVILNSNEWSIPETNEILISEKLMQFRDFRLSRNTQQMEISHEMPGEEKEHIGISFENFRLAGLLSYLNPEKALASGRLNGNFIVEEPFGSTGLVAGLQVDELEVLEVPLGRLSLEAKALSDEKYDFSLALKEGNVDLDLAGDYLARETGAELNLDLLLHDLQMKTVEGLSQGELQNSGGSISGQMKVGGTINELEYKGNINFDNANFIISKLNTAFTFPNENMALDNQGVYFENFNIEDEKGNLLVMKGEILTESLFNPDFDLQLTANDFQLLNSTREDFDLFYGTAIFDVDAKLTGNLNLPKLDMELKVGPDTDVTYTIPEASLEIEEREGVVMFVNREDPDDILTRSREQEKSVTISGFEIDALFSIGKNAILNVVINEQTDDNFRVFGEGDLNFNMYPNGRTTLTGRYEISGGHYEMSLYGLVNRRFELASGGSITWAGDPFDANLDVSAIYEVETSASSLMAPQVSGLNTGVNGRFRQELPFLVYLNVDGELMKPVISFNLEMPESEQGAIGGQVYGRIQQLNQQENELNKQVFSLLVLNRFFPDSGSDGSAGGTVAIARDNLNQALSDQLNMFSNQFFGGSGIELQFGLDSYTDYQGESPQDRTQLDISAQKRLLDERLMVQVGSEVDIQGSNQGTAESNPIIGNVSLEYMLTEDGRFRLKGFRRNQFENVIDGQLIVSGIALIFTQEFNKFIELWQAIFKGGLGGSNEE